MPEAILQILMVEDSQADARLILRELSQSGLNYHVTRVESESEFVSHLNPSPDVVLCDYNLPQFNAVRALEILRARSEFLPFIIISGSIGEETAVEVMRLGASDYLLKDRLGRLSKAISSAVERHRLSIAEEKTRAMLSDQARANAIRAGIASVMASSGGFREFLLACCDELVKHVDNSFVRIWTLCDGDRQLESLGGRLGDESDDISLAHKVAVGETVIGQIAADRFPRISNCLANEPRLFDPDWVERERLVSFAGFPLIVENRLIGVLAIFARQVVAPTLFDHLAGVCDLIAQVVDRKRTEEALAIGERRYRELADAIPQIVWTAGSDGALDHLNARATEYTGLNLEELIGWSWTNIIHPDDIKHLVGDWQDIIRTGLPRPLEFRIRRWDGEYRWHITRQVVSRSPEGAVVRWYGTSTDIHDQKVAEAALRESEARFRLLVETIPHKMWMTDSEGMTTFLNQRGIQRFGLTEEAIHGVGWLNLLHPDDVEAARISWLASVANAVPYRSEYRMRQVNGEYRWYLSQGVPLPGPNGKPEKWVGTWTDINDQKKAEEMVRVSSELLHAVSVSTTDAVFVKDREGRYLLFNPAASRFVGMPAEEVIGKTDEHIFDAVSASKVRTHDNKVMEQGVACNFEEVLTAGGSTRTYLVTKAPYRSPSGEIIGLVGISRDVTQARLVQEELLLRDRAIMAVTQGIVITDPSQPDNPIIYSSPYFETLTGYSADEVKGRNCRLLQGKDTDPNAVEAIRRAIQERRIFTTEILNYRKEGTPFWNGLTIAPVMDGDKLTNYIAVLTDVSERRKLEDQYRQSQKMEAVGQLAGGIAHDFNNLLTIINGYSDIVIGDQATTDQVRAVLGEIRTAGERAAGLTAQLLAFSRKTIVDPKILNLNDLVDSIAKMLRRLIGEDIRFTTNLEPKLKRFKADQSLVEQVILNLAVNARDAMPRGGRLTIETHNLVIPSERMPEHPEALSGCYVQLTVSDTGVGMTPEVMAKIFEPFFTTKGVGKGTGLGLATVYGIMKQSGGYIDVSSEPGRGTRFDLLFPAVSDAPKRIVEAGNSVSANGSETVLLVEDEDSVRKLSRMALSLKGYTVFEASRGEDALRLFEKHLSKIQIVVTDVVMPDMGGRALADALRAIKPDLKVLYVSGYTNDAVVRNGVSESSDAFLQKPFTPAMLAKKIRSMLDGSK